MLFIFNFQSSFCIPLFRIDIHYHSIVVGTWTFIKILFFVCISVWLGSLCMSVSLFLSPITIGICRKKSTRLTAVIGGLVIALGCLFTSFANQFHQMYFSLGIMLGNVAVYCNLKYEYNIHSKYSYKSILLKYHCTKDNIIPVHQNQLIF